MFAIDLFEHIAAGNEPAIIDGRPLTAAIAANIVLAHSNLSDRNRKQFLGMPMDFIIDFASHVDETPKRPSFKQYLRETEKRLAEGQAATAEAIDHAVRAEVRDEPVVIDEAVGPSSAPSSLEAATVAFEDIDHAVRAEARDEPMLINEAVGLSSAPSSLLETLHQMATTLTTQRAETFALFEGIVDRMESLAARLREPPPAPDFDRLYEVNAHLVAALTKLVERIEQIRESPPVVNVPAPQIHVSLPERKPTVKMVERDERGFITRVTESEED